MKKAILAYFLLLCFVALQSQEPTSDPVMKGIQTSHQIKVGASLQYEWSGWYYYEYDYDYYYEYSYDYSSNLSYYDGPNTQLFLAYEHIWTFPTNMGVSIEPKLGLAFREYLTSGFVGANWKFYWVDRGSWRMGIYLYTGYEYLQGGRSIYVNMQEGMYRQLIDITMHQNIFSFDLGLVPFQFTPDNTPVSLFCILNSVFCILYSVFCILYSVFCILKSITIIIDQLLCNSSSGIFNIDRFNPGEKIDSL